MSYVGEETNVSEVRNGVVELFKMYPNLAKEYRNGGIFLKYNEDMQTYCSNGKLRVEKLPDAFKDCNGEYGKGTISLENIVEYDENILRGTLAIYEKTYSDDIEGYSYYVGLAESIDFNLRDFVPLANAKSWSSPEELPGKIKSFVNGLLEDGVLRIVSRVHMVEDTPVISTSSKQNGSTDYGFVETLISWTKNTPIKDVYIIATDCVSRYVMRKHGDGEFTITMF